MNFKTIRKRILLVIMVTVLMLTGISLGSWFGYSRGYRHGQKVTNGWWIDKQSKYYDSVEVEKKRQSSGFNKL